MSKKIKEDEITKEDKDEILVDKDTILVDEDVKMSDELENSIIEAFSKAAEAEAEAKMNIEDPLDAVAYYLVIPENIEAITNVLNLVDNPDSLQQIIDILNAALVPVTFRQINDMENGISPEPIVEVTTKPVGTPEDSEKTESEESNNTQEEVPTK